MKMNATISYLIAGTVTFALPLHVSAAEMGAREFGNAIVEILDAHGYGDASYEDVAFEGGVLTIQGLSTPEAAIPSFSAGAIRIDQINERDGDTSGWLGFGSIDVMDLRVAGATGWEVNLPEARVTDLWVQNTNTDIEAEQHGYEFIDGPYSNFRFGGVTVDDLAFGNGDGLAVRLSGEARSGNWTDNSRLPQTMEFILSVDASRNHGMPTGLVLSGGLDLDRFADLLTVNLRAQGDGDDALSGQLVVSGMTSPRVDDLVKTLFGSATKEHRVYDQARLSRLALAATGFGGLAMVLEAAYPGNTRFESQVRGIAQFVFDGSSTPKVVEITPKGRMTLHGVMEGALSDAEISKRAP